MTFRYPYESKTKNNLSNLHKGIDYFIWQGKLTLKTRVAHITNPIIELGGPTDSGFFFLDSLELQSKPLITNISPNPMPYSDNAKHVSQEVSQLVDATSMPYDNTSVGMFLMAAMSISSDWWVELDEDAKDEASATIEKEFAAAQLEMGQVALGILEPNEVVYAQRVKIYSEIYRTLVVGGLLFSDGGLEEITILKKIGFELVACLQVQDDNAHGWRSSTYEFVVAKR